MGFTNFIISIAEEKLYRSNTVYNVEDVIQIVESYNLIIVIKQSNNAP